MRWRYPFLVGLFFGVIQTGYFLRLSFALASTYGTFLMVTLAWLMGSIVGLRLKDQGVLTLRRCLVISLLAYGLTLVIVSRFQFQTGLWPLYAVLIVVSGAFAGYFFAVMGSAIHPTRYLFFAENNGFLLGIVAFSLLYLWIGPLSLWAIPAMLVVLCYLATPDVKRLALENTLTTHQAVTDAVVNADKNTSDVVLSDAVISEVPISEVIVGEPFTRRLRKD